ncbi:spermidine synthase [Roseospira navarrensis]|uniref:Spermidine synthase n=1 Tax=Roseospira navarrensis TaxID=140058 RepID=A0A7X2D4G3_9PROT|nr:spermidine synthase [Roseospira navarrensis]
MRALYAAVLLLTSAASLVVEIVAGRMLAPYVGMSLYTWTAVIAVVLAGLSLGNGLGGVWSRDDRATASGRLALILAAAALTTAAAVPLIRAVAPWVEGLGLGVVGRIGLMTLILFLPPSLFAGMAAPMLTRLAMAARPDRPGATLGIMYAMGSAGGIAGTLLAGYVFISWIGTIGTLLAVAAVYALCALPFAFMARRAAPRRTALAGATTGLLAGALGLWTHTAGALAPACTVESDYYCIRTADFSADSGRPSTLMVLDHMVHGINDRDDPALLYAPYVALTDRLARVRLGLIGPEAPPVRAFFVGGGAYTLPRAWAATLPEAEIVVAEVDPAVTRAARDHAWFDPASIARILHGDARRALRDWPVDRPFDIIVGDAFHDFSAPPHLSTQEFARLIRARLAEGGLYLMNVVDDAHDPRFLLALVRTWRTVFPTVEVWADREQLAGSGRITYLMLAADAPTPVAALTGAMVGDPQDPRVGLRWQPPALAARVAADGDLILTDDLAPVDRLLAPVANAGG